MLRILRTVFPPIHPAGWPFIAAFAVLDIALWVAEDWLGWLGLILVAWCVYFFRNPDRVTPLRDGLVISPADGFVQSIEQHLPPSELGMAAQPLTRISVFMNIFDVHVNRVPVDATVVATSYRPGRFFNASLDKASELNERQSVRLRVADGRELALVQIAGLVARRISCRLDQGQPARVGERFGLIRFGSRVDVYLPEGVAPLVIAGQRATAGETVLADLASGEAPRVGEMR